MPSPPIALYLTTIASQPALRQRQGSFENPTPGYIYLDKSYRIHLAYLTGQEDPFHIV